MDLAEFLLARIAEDEDAAQAAIRHPAPADADAVYVSWSRHDTGWVPAASGEWTEGSVLFARWDPARVLAECEAKRRIVELHRSEPGYFHHGASTGSVAAWDSVPPDADIADGQPACTTCGEFSEYGVPWPCPTLRLLALPYAGHEGYREEWRV